MHTMTLLPEKQLSLNEFKSFIEAMPNATWADGLGVHRAVIEEDQGHVYVDFDDNYGIYFDNYLSSPRRTELLARLGFAPRIALHIHASPVDVGSDALAQVICKLLIQRWGGIKE